MGLLDNSADTSTGDMIRGLLNAPAGGAAASQAPVVFNYQPVISTADINQAIQALTPAPKAARQGQHGVELAAFFR
jgi:hypothetical protein